MVIICYQRFSGPWRIWYIMKDWILLTDHVCDHQHFVADLTCNKSSITNIFIFYNHQKFGALRAPPSSSCGGLVAFGHQMGALRAPWTKTNTIIVQTQILIHIQHKQKYNYGPRTNITTGDKFVRQQQEQQQQQEQYETYL